MFTIVFCLPATNQDVWMPNLRGIPLGREGEIVAEFEIASSLIRNDANEDDLGLRRGGGDDYDPCLDPASRAILYPQDNFEWLSNDFQRPLPLRGAVQNLAGRFSIRRSDGSIGSYQSLEIQGRCCWETFSRPRFQGRMLRLCRGKYRANVLGNLADNIQSIRPVEHF
jgi:hypothetical protein